MLLKRKDGAALVLSASYLISLNLQVYQTDTGIANCVLSEPFSVSHTRLEYSNDSCTVPVTERQAFIASLFDDSYVVWYIRV